MSSDSSSAPTMRVYVHSVANDNFGAWPVVSFVFVAGVGAASPTVRQMKVAFKEELFRLHFSKELARLPIMTQGIVLTAEGKELKDEQRVAEALQDRDDVFVELRGPAAPAPVVPAAKAKAAEGAKVSPTIQFSSGGGEPITINRSELGALDGAGQMIYQQLAQAREHQSKGQLRKAKEIYLAVLDKLPAEPKGAAASAKDATGSGEMLSSARQIAHQQLGVIYLYNKFYEQARPHFEHAVRIITSATSGPNSDVVKGIGKTPQTELSQLVSLTGQCWFGVGDFSESTPTFERALKLLTPKGEDNPKDAKLLGAIQDAKVWLARSLYRGNAKERSEALAMFEALIAQNEHHIAALTYYAQIAIECGKKGEVLPYLLRALVASQAAGPQKPKGAASYEAAIQQKDKKEGGIEIDPQLLDLVQTLITDLVSAKDGVRTLFRELHAASSNHSALSFLAQTVKDQGGVTAAIEIYRRALEVCELPPRPQANLLLNLVHTMELEYQYQDAYLLIKKYLKDNQELTVGKLRIGEFYDAIQNVNDVYDISLRTGTAAGVPAYCEIGKIFDEGTCHITMPSSTPPKKSTAILYPADELNIMALMMTAVKMLYVCGGLQVLPTLINLLEPLRVDRDLHLTNIRNEHAYYSSIAQMMRSISYPIPAELANNPEDTIYVCGDSHSMSAAWQVIKLDSHPRPVLLQPKLVTGLKCWHLRPACRFYPKRNFEAAMRSIPSKAQVIFNFGEIDCREGLIVAVEKGRYETIDQGIHLAVDVYVKAMQEQVAKKSMRVYVHPITPVLDVTRPTVKKFNAHMRERVEATVGKNKKAGESPLLYLDFFPQLLTADGTGFNMLYHLDSTHLKPTYVHALLQPALNKVYVPNAGVRAAAASSASTLDAINAKMLRAQKVQHQFVQPARQQTQYCATPVAAPLLPAQTLLPPPAPIQFQPPFIPQAGTGGYQFGL